MAWRSVQTVAVTLLLVLADYVAAEESASSSCTVGITERTSFPHDGLEYIQWESAQSGIRPSHQIIIPSMRFNCHGFIANWSALTVLYRVFTIHSHHIHFQVWRPIGNERYKRVHNDDLKFLSFELQNNNIVLPNDGNVESFEFVEREPQGEDRSYFQPGDVLGVFIPPPPAAFPIGITYRNATPDDDISTVVDIYSVPAAEQLCEMSLCAENIIKFSGVIPHLSLSYETIDPAVPTPTPVTDSCSSTSFATCIPSPSTSLTFTPTPLPTPPCCTEEGSIMPLLIVGVSSGVVVICIVLVVIGVLVKRKQILRQFRKRRAIHTNPTYETPDGNVQLRRVSHFEATNGALYALPDPRPPPLPTYASAYQTNGECHTYHELPDTTFAHQISRDGSPTNISGPGRESIRSLGTQRSFPIVGRGGSSRSSVPILDRRNTLPNSHHHRHRISEPILDERTPFTNATLEPRMPISNAMRPSLPTLEPRMPVPNVVRPSLPTLEPRMLTPNVVRPSLPTLEPPTIVVSRSSSMASCRQLPWFPYAYSESGSSVNLPTHASDLNFPNYTEPDFPKYTEPSFPKYTEPSFPKYTEPSFPKYTEPSFPKYTEPSLPNYTEPSFPKYTEPSFPKPSLPNYTEPSFPNYTEPENHPRPVPRVRQLYVSLDEEGLHVPTVAEREKYQGEEVYSKLSRCHSRVHSRDSRDSRDTTFFEQSDLYWEPPSSTNELYDTLAQRKYREIQRDQLSIGKTLGSGHFATVHQGLWYVPGGSVDVAVKNLKQDASEEDKVKFLQEAAIMGQFLHPNVVKLYGVVTVGEPLMIVLELMPKGDLKGFLRSFQKKPASAIPPDLPMLLLGFCRQIAVGLNYLSNKAFVHRDLAARNIFLTEDLTCKIGDFGMARDLAEDDVYQSQGGKVPLKWTAPEALNYRKYSTASDVWSYGMLLFEIWSLGRKPFEKVNSTSKLVSLVNSGHCQAPPPGCPRAIYQIMVLCWHTVSSRRPSFSEICDYLNASNELLLSWGRSDRVVSQRVMELGAPLSEARNLYPDLQYTYDTS